jgi:tRNA (cytidine/uridine-2'-O-)-methyltransferase
MFQVILFEPEIPPNTGNVIRLCANTGSTLHLIEPLGFRLDAKSVQRAGLDYSELAAVMVHDNFDACMAAVNAPRLFAVETGAAQKYTDPAYRPGDAFLFGPETRGLPASVLARIPPTQWLSIPMREHNRSLNLSNAVAVVVFEAWRQQGFTRLPI